VKGHGTENDFVIVPDPDGSIELNPSLVAALCDRRAGVGADGVLRVTTAAVAQASGVFDRLPEGVAPGDWYMDYRNADGSIAEMCGNGVRVYARYLLESGLATGSEIPILTRAGVVVARVGDEAISVDMPVPVVYGSSTARLSGVDYAGTVATCGNPHLVCWVDDPDKLELFVAPSVEEEQFPDGVNVEFVAPVADGHVRLRVVERGVGETQSCGSGACVVAAVALRERGRDRGEVRVDVPGGSLTVALEPDRCVLTGPAVIVATGVVDVDAAG